MTKITIEMDVENREQVERVLRDVLVHMNMGNRAVHSGTYSYTCPDPLFTGRVIEESVPEENIIEETRQRAINELFATLGDSLGSVAVKTVRAEAQQIAGRLVPIHNDTLAEFVTCSYRHTPNFFLLGDVDSDRFAGAIIEIDKAVRFAIEEFLYTEMLDAWENRDFEEEENGADI